MRCTLHLRVHLLLMGTLAAGCAPAVPVLGGGMATPADRLDVGLGGTARIPLGDLETFDATGAPEDGPAEDGSTEDGSPGPRGDRTAPGGIAPVAFARWGLSREADLGLMASGALLRLDGRYQHRLQDDDLSILLMGSAAPFVGVVEEGGIRYGADVPLLLGLHGASLVELWIGPTLGVERVAPDGQADATALKAGGVLGLATGFRNFHALAELTARWERWSVDGTVRTGWSLTPAFALRLRF